MENQNKHISSNLTIKAFTFEQKMLDGSSDLIKQKNQAEYVSYLRLHIPEEWHDGWYTQLKVAGLGD